ncbi:MAG: LPP20 family lipoprotein [Hydrogenovibrio sp.]|uniref:LPP20 family lipoprotein n=1 Tax=Hydrogenovibrio sp. TaxID=2065821 RepID=UPI0028704AF0|nr:LPP20 family lipoprotein [Hydrogenovibrio sp.]MDR9499295.1 LPP20 family lipoprotein [Hydrogenovibrio sp.]
MTVKPFLWMALSLLFLAGCSGQETKEAEAEAEKAQDPVSEPVVESVTVDPQACVYPGSDVPAPGWVCDQPVEGLALSTVGIAEPSAGGISFMKTLAAADGRGRLAAQMQVQVDQMVKQYLGSTGRGESETIDAVASVTTKTLVRQELIGSRVYQTRTGPNGRLYALVGLDPVNYAQVVEQTALNSMNKHQALWQTFKAEQSFEEMASDLANRSVSGDLTVSEE